MQIISSVYCDKVVCTAPPEAFSDMGLQLNELVESCHGKTEVYDDGYRELRLKDGGLVLLQQKSSWSRITINGKACMELRLLKRFDEALAIIGTFPHKVTQIHAKVDLRSKSTPKLLNKLRKLSLEGQVFGYDYEKLQHLPNMRPDRLISHNLYAPKIPGEIQRCYYDKTLERHKAKKLSSDMWSSDENLSVELRVTNRVTRKGLSLRDASSPTALYWHYMSDCPIVGKYQPKKPLDWITQGSHFECSIIKRSDDEKLNDMLRFGGDIFMIGKLAGKLGRGDEAQKVLKKLIAEHTCSEH